MTNPTTTRRAATSVLVLFVSYVAFISLGFPDAVLGVAWPSIRDIFDLPETDLSFIFFTSSAGYILSGLVSGKLIGRLGVGTLLVLSTGGVAAALLGYAITPVFPLLLGFAVFVGLGSGAIDSALNFFAAERFSEAVMSRLHAFFGIGALVGPLIMGAVLELDASWRRGYVVVAAILFAMAVCFVWTRRLWDDHGHQHHQHHCVGVENTAGLWAFTVMTERFGQPVGIGSLWAGLYWGAPALGRLTLGTISERVGTARMVQISICGNIVGGLLYASGIYGLAVFGLLLMGFRMAPLFPLLMSLTPRRLGTATAVHAVGFQVSAAVLGGAVLPGTAGYLAALTNQSAIAWVAVAGGIAFFTLHAWMMRLDPVPQTA